MRVLVTRPQPAASTTAAALRAAGHEPIVAPLFGIEPTGVTVPDGPVAAVLATSPHALDAVAGEAARWRGLPLHVVGARAAAVAETLDWRVATSSGDVKALLAHLVAAHREPAHFLYCAGRVRKPDLEQALSRAGHAVTVAEVYRAVRVSVLPEAICAALANRSLDAVFHFSRRSAQKFRELVRHAGFEEAALALRHVAISADAGEPWADASPWVGPQPDQTGLMMALRDAAAVTSSSQRSDPAGARTPGSLRCARDDDP